MREKPFAHSAIVLMAQAAQTHTEINKLVVCTTLVKSGGGCA